MTILGYIIGFLGLACFARAGVQALSDKMEKAMVRALLGFVLTFIAAMILFNY